MSAERRQFIRCFIPESGERAVLRAPDREIVGQLLDTSTGGFCIEVASDAALKSGEEYELDIDCGACRVRVVHLHEAGAPATRVGLERLSDVVGQQAVDVAANRRFDLGLPKLRWELFAVLPLVAILIAATIAWDMVGEVQTPRNGGDRQAWGKAVKPSAAASDSLFAVPEHPRRAAAGHSTSAGPQRDIGTSDLGSSRGKSFHFDVGKAFANFEAIESQKVGVALSLSKTQKRHIRTLLDGTARRLFELRGTVADTSAESAAVIQQASQKLQDLLDARQKTIWSELQETTPTVPDKSADGLVDSAR